jgi:hypothetical protein
MWRLGLSDQLSLFSVKERSVGRYLSKQPHQLEISAETLQNWKQRVFQYQQQVVISPLLEQGTLFDLAATPTATADNIDPFKLPQQNTEFWRWKADDQGVSALYFVIDYELPILLYVGETVKSGQRWKGEHDCKRHLLNYRQAHSQHQCSTLLGIAFWLNAPEQTRPRQQLESALIHKWRSPFNKENWEFWGTPFIGEK